MDRYGEMLVFVRAVEDGGFSAAGRTLSLSPSAVSKLVARMEARLGVLLFRRSHRTLSLTPEGETYYAAALRAIEAVEETETSVYAGHAAHDTLRIRSMPTFAASQLARHLRGFCQANPTLKLEVMLRMEPGNLLDQGIDVAIHVGELADSSSVAHRFTGTRWVICASPGYIAEFGAPRTPADLARHQCLNFIPGMVASTWKVKGSRRGPRILKIRSNLLTNQGQMLMELGRAGAGIVRLAEFHIVDELASGRLVELFPEHQDLQEDPIYAVYHSRRHLSPRIRVFLDFLDATFPNDPPLWRRERVVAATR